MFETHAHTRPFSPDAIQSLDELVASASALGFAGTVATEHMDPDLGQGEMWFDLDDFFAAMASARSALPDGFRLLNGIEAGYQSHLADRYRDMTATHPFDHVIGSVHALRGDDIYFVQDVFLEGRETAYGAYLDALIEMASSGRWFDVLGHYDYVARFSGYAEPLLTYREQPDRFDRLFRQIIANGQALELNARSIRAMERVGLRDPMPDPDIFLRYRELGGDLIAVGSDAHATNEVGLYRSRIRDYLLGLGFRRTFVYIDRSPVDIPL